MLNMHLLEIVVWTILFFVVLGTIFQYLSNRAAAYHSAKMRHLIQQNKKLAENIEQLHKQIYSLNLEIGRITAENIILKDSLKELQERVNCLQVSLLKKHPDFPSC